MKNKPSYIPLTIEQRLCLKVGHEVFWINKNSDPEESQVDDWVIEHIDHSTGKCVLRWNNPHSKNGVDEYFNENALIADLLFKSVSAEGANGTQDSEQGSNDIDDQTKLQLLLDLFSNSDVIVVDGGPLLSHVDVEEIIDDPDNEVVCATWESDGCSYEAKFTEKGLLDGRWKEGIFFANDHGGNKSSVVFYELRRKSLESNEPVLF